MATDDNLSDPIPEPPLWLAFPAGLVALMAGAAFALAYVWPLIFPLLGHQIDPQRKAAVQAVVSWLTANGPIVVAPFILIVVHSLNSAIGAYGHRRSLPYFCIGLVMSVAFGIVVHVWPHWLVGNAATLLLAGVGVMLTVRRVRELISATSATHDLHYSFKSL
jgi:hypothetical protein